MLQCYSVFKRLVADSQPADVTLTHMPESLCFIYVVMEFPLYNRLKILLHLSAGYVNNYGERHYTAFFKPLFNVGTHYCYFIILNLIELFCPDQLKSRWTLSAEFYKHILFSYPLTLKSRAVSNRDRGFLNSNLETSDLKSSLNDFWVVKLFFNLFINTYTGRMKNRNICISNCRVSHVNCAGTGWPLDIIKFT